MDLPLDPTVPLGGIALILLLVWLTGGRRQAVITGPGEATVLLATPETDFSASQIVVSQAGDVALASDAGGRIAVVFACGDRLAARKLSHNDIAAITVAPQAGDMALLSIRTTAFTRPDFTLQLAAASAADWQRRLAGTPA